MPDTEAVWQSGPLLEQPLDSADVRRLYEDR
jgi:hypothetical protein